MTNGVDSREMSKAKRWGAGAILAFYIVTSAAILFFLLYIFILDPPRIANDTDLPKAPVKYEVSESDIGSLAIEARAAEVRAVAAEARVEAAEDDADIDAAKEVAVKARAEAVEAKARAAARAKTKIHWNMEVLRLIFGMGVLGGCIHGLNSLGDYVGNRTLQMRWLVWFGTRPLVGGLLALIVFLVISGGFGEGAAGIQAGSGDSINANKGAADIFAPFDNLYAVAGMAGLVGMFSKQATDWLSHIFNAIFRSDADQNRGDRVNEPVPEENPADAGKPPPAVSEEDRDEEDKGPQGSATENK